MNERTLNPEERAALDELVTLAEESGVHRARITEMRKDAGEGLFDVVVGIGTVREDRIHPPTLCPRCARRPVRFLRTGLCGVCYAHALAAAEAHRRLDAIRQRKKRVLDALAGKESRR